MTVNFDFSLNFVEALMAILMWGILGFLAFRIYKKQPGKPRVWKVVVVLWVGLFSFSIDWNMFDTLVKFPVLPLGVWILFFILRNKEERWERYRAFAWLGFFANFLFLAAALATIPIQQAAYPVHDAATYIADVKNASVMAIHPSGQDVTLNREELRGQMSSFKKKEIYSERWYMETYENPAPIPKERFPYLLMGTEPKWGSGLDTIIYVEADGKGLLVTTAKKQVYFRSNVSLLGGGK